MDEITDAEFEAMYGGGRRATSVTSKRCCAGTWPARGSSTCCSTRGEPGHWVDRRCPQMSAPLEEATWAGDGVRGIAGVRYLQPEIVLLFKAKHVRPKDVADFEAAVPLLELTRREWLRAAVQRAHPGHVWLARL